MSSLGFERKVNFSCFRLIALLAFCSSTVALTLSSCDKARVDVRPSPDSGSIATDISSMPKTSNKLVVGDEKTLAEWLAKSHGSVVLIDFWATWCGPCVQQFSHIVELSNQHRKDGFRVFAVSMDEPDDKPSVSDFLKRENADFETLLTRYGIGAEFVNAFDIRGDIPFYRLYDRKGQLRYSFSADPEGIQNCEAIDKIDERVKELLMEVL